MKKREKILNSILPLVAVFCIIVIWAVASKVIDSEYILPSVNQTLEEVFALFCKSEFYLSFLLTLLRSVISFVISFGLSFVLAFLAVKRKYAERVILPIISLIRAMPTIAVVLLLLFWTNSKIAPVIVTMMVVFPTTYTHIKSALETVDSTSVEAGMVDGADKKQVFLRIELPQILPAVLSAIGSGISLNFKLMVAAEVIAQTANSLGYLLNTAKVYFEIAEMIALVCVAVAFGILIEFVFNKLSKKSGQWK